MQSTLSRSYSPPPSFQRVNTIPFTSPAPFLTLTQFLAWIFKRIQPHNSRYGLLSRMDSDSTPLQVHVVLVHKSAGSSLWGSPARFDYMFSSCVYFEFVLFGFSIADLFFLLNIHLHKGNETLFFLIVDILIMYILILIYSSRAYFDFFLSESYFYHWIFMCIQGTKPHLLFFPCMYI